MTVKKIQRQNEKRTKRIEALAKEQEFNRKKIQEFDSIQKKLQGEERKS